MGDYIELFPRTEDPAEMNRAQVLALLEDLRTQLAELDAQEPEDMESEAYEDWGDRHEDLEDRIDEALDRLDELEE